MANFEKAINFVLKHEGGFVDHKKDPGGTTNYGISLRFLKSTKDLDYDFDNDGDIDADDIACLTKEDAKNIYREHWWDKYNYEKLEWDDVAAKLLDLSIWMGQSQAVKLFQRSIKKMGFNIDIDGIMGPKTIKAMNMFCKQKSFKEILIKECQIFLNSLIDKNKDLIVFLKGWMRRAKEFL